VASDNGSWSLAEEWFARGDPRFVDELRRITDGERLARFAGTWFDDPRPEARRLLVDYLSRPLNAYRHEALVKRLFKRAEQIGDDELMGCFLVLFDRSLRRARRKRHRHKWDRFPNRAAAQAAVALWQAQGYQVGNLSEYRGQVHAWGSKTEEVVIEPANSTMPRPQENWLGRAHPIPDHLRRQYERQRLFTPRTRRYLRRRAWRYFRKLGREHPQRYVPALLAALKRYEDADVADEIALLDNWGLIHALFHHSPALVAPAKGWQLAPGRTLAELAPAPIYEELWRTKPVRLFDLVRSARCRTVRQWAIHMLRRDHAAVLAGLPLEELFALLGHEDAEVVAFGVELLRSAPGVEDLPAERWLKLLETDDPQRLQVLCELMEARLQPERVMLAEAVRLACARPLPVARLGFGLLKGKRPQAAEEHAVLGGLCDAACDALRLEMVRWLRGMYESAPEFQKSWVLDFFDSKHADVRAEGWRWLTERAELRDDLAVWLKLLESPYDDVKLLLVADLEARVAAGGVSAEPVERADPDLIRFLWASVLLNIHRGGRSKPMVIRQVTERLRRHPDEAKDLLPMLGVALRSLRGPEFRGGLAAVVQLLERRPDLEPAVRAAFPELQMSSVV
jgi:hypothetical protein